jgi:hypothetical protein
MILRFFTPVLALSMLASSCSDHFLQKRKYKHGYYLAWAHKKHVRSETLTISVPETIAPEAEKAEVVFVQPQNPSEAKSSHIVPADRVLTAAIPKNKDGAEKTVTNPPSKVPTFKYSGFRQSFIPFTHKQEFKKSVQKKRLLDGLLTFLYLISTILSIFLTYLIIRDLMGES